VAAKGVGHQGEVAILCLGCLQEQHGNADACGLAFFVYTAFEVRYPPAIRGQDRVSCFSVVITARYLKRVTIAARPRLLSCRETHNSCACELRERQRLP